MTYITGPAHAEKELVRLREIETELQDEVIRLMDDKTYLASTMRSICTDRLRYQIRPAIKECVDMIRKHA